MRIRVIESYRSDKGIISAGSEQEVEDEEARRLIRGGIAEEVEAPKARRARKAEAHEFDVEEGQENARRKAKPEDSGDVVEVTQ